MWVEVRETVTYVEEHTKIKGISRNISDIGDHKGKRVIRKNKED